MRCPASSTGSWSASKWLIWVPVDPSQDALASPDGVQLPSEVWRSDSHGAGDAEPLYPWVFTAIGLERVSQAEAETPGKGSRKGRGRSARRAAGRIQDPGKANRFPSLAWTPSVLRVALNPWRRAQYPAETWAFCLLPVVRSTMAWHVLLLTNFHDTACSIWYNSTAFVLS